MANFLEDLQNLGADFNAPMVADPNLNMAGLLLGAGLLQPVQPGQTPAGTFGQALTGSLGYLSRQRAEEAKLKQTAAIEGAKVAATREGTEAQREIAGVRGAQDQQQFEAGLEARAQQHAETMARLDKQYQLAVNAQKGDKLRDKANVGKLGLDFADTFVDQNPDAFLGPDKKTLDPRAVQAFRTLQQNRMLRTFGHEPQDYMPYGPQDVQDVAGLALTNPQRYQLILGDRALIYGPKYVQEVNDAVLKGPTAQPTALGEKPVGGKAPKGPGFEPPVSGGEGIFSRIHKAISPPSAYVKTDSGEVQLEPGKMVTINGKQYKAVAPAGKDRWQLLDQNGVARFYRVDRVENGESK